MILKRIAKSNAKKLENNYRKKYGKVCLNIGCGQDYKNGWINIDNNSDNNISKLDLNWDMRYPLPFDDNSIDYIYHEHFLEHLTVEESKKSLNDMKRVLRSGGVMRIAMPNLADAIDNYLDKNWKKRPFIKRFNLESIQTPAELLNMNFSWWGHKWLYDWDELERRLNEIGFHKIRKERIMKSSIDVLNDLETRDESTLIAEVVK